MEEKKAQTETFVTIFICLYSDFLVPLPKKIKKKIFFCYFIFYYFDFVVCIYLLYLSSLLLYVKMISFYSSIFQCIFKLFWDISKETNFNLIFKIHATKYLERKVELENMWFDLLIIYNSGIRIHRLWIISALQEMTYLFYWIADVKTANKLTKWWKK